MNAISATKRMTLVMMSLLLILTTSALAKDDQHGYLGVMLQKITTSMSKALQLDEDEGVMISQVVDDGPAAKAGFEDGDVILKFDGKAIESFGDLNKAMKKTSPGDKVAIEILHNGKRQTAEVELGEAEKNSFTYSMNSDGDAPDVEFFSDGDHENVWFSEDGGTVDLIMKNGTFGSDRGFMGVELNDLNDQLGEYFGIEDGEGALVSKVRDDSPAAAAGLKAGDVIVSVNGDSVEDSGEVYEAMNDTEPEQEIEVKVVRKGKNKTLKVTLGEMPEGEFPRFMGVPHAPNMTMDFLSEGKFPHGMTHDIRVAAPRGMHKIREIHRLHEDTEDLDEVREELDVLREELESLKEELKK
ncbi:MAG: PDZ domain-containing protein [Candidatus Krumholzibacteria bacterium]|nr:PDZ domain-containing protein [Candidatus Krumholzibacteria bacterium]